DRPGGGGELLALQPGVDQVDHVIGQRGDVGHGLVLDLAAVTVGAPQVGRGVVPLAALLVDVPGLPDSDYVHLAAVSRHGLIVWGTSRIMPYQHTLFLTTFREHIPLKPQFRMQRLERATATSV